MAGLLIVAHAVAGCASSGATARTARTAHDGPPAAPSVPPALAGLLPPTADRPTYGLGQTWIRGDGAYVITAIKGDRYVFSAGAGREIHLTRDLSVAKIVRGRSQLELIPPPSLTWPLEVGASGETDLLWTDDASSTPRGKTRAAWSVDAVETVETASGSFETFRIEYAFAFPGDKHRTLTMWYAPEAGQFVKATGEDVGVPPLDAVARAKRQPPATPAPLRIAVREPIPAGEIDADHVSLDVEITGGGRAKSLIVAGTRGERRRVQSPAPPRDEPWVVSVVVPLAEGDNDIGLEAADEHGASARTRVRLTRQSLVTVELAGPSGATVTVDGKPHTLDATGTLTLRLRPGTYRLEAMKEGYVPVRQPLSLAPGQGRVEHRLAMARSVAPTLIVTRPLPGALIRTPDVKLAIEVRGPSRPRELTIRPANGPAQTLTPRADVRGGVPWSVEAVVALAEGDNTVAIEATDEHGTRASETVVLTRRTLVAFELRGPAGTDVRVDDTDYVLDARGMLRIQVAPGDHRVEATRDGFEPWQETVKVRPGAGTVQKQIALVPVSLPPSALAALGQYHALVIGNQAYPRLRPLQTPIADATAVADLLRREYRFQSVQMLTDATRTQIVRALDDLRRNLKEHDNLLVYYAGHGWLDRDSDRGYWLPVDAEPDSRANWLSNADITDALKALKAKHVVIVADSCYSGTLTRGMAVQPSGGSDLVRLAQRKARTVLTSGGLEPVADTGGGKHSVFAGAFLRVLRENPSVADLTSLFSVIRRQVLLNAEQTPEYADIRLAGHDGGDFIFVRKR